MELKLDKGAKALVIVAHPDDETIWMGGTLARFREVEWTIFALCRESDADRMPKFMNVAKYYGARGIICDLEDEDIMNVEQSVLEVQKITGKRLKPKNFDYLFVHAANGEYGHPRHIGAHLGIIKLLKAKELRVKQAFCFAYYADKRKKVYNAPKAELAVSLTEKEWQAKRNVVKKMYGFNRKSFENVSCLRIETFSRI